MFVVCFCAALIAFTMKELPGAIMRTFENLLVAGSTELPECRCGAEMHLAATKPLEDTEIRIFRCAACNHEFQLMVWMPLKETGPATQII